MTCQKGGKAQGDHPPKPRFALSVGVVGHRPKDLAKVEDPIKDKALHEKRLKQVCDDVKTALAAIDAAAIRARSDHYDCFDQSDSPEPMLILVSALAEGADTIAAKAALALGYALDAPLPFARSDYEGDFIHASEENADPIATEKKTLDSLAEFQSLLKRARTLELPGQRALPTDTKEEGKLRENRAYEAAGLTVLSQADIVLAVWDRELSRGRGGTAELVAEAARAGMPIILVDAKGERPIEVRWRNLMKFPAPIVAIDDLPAQSLADGIPRLVDELVRLPAAPDQIQGYHRWLKESGHCINPRIGYPALLLLALRWFKSADLFPKQPAELAEEYVKEAVPGDAGGLDKLAQPYGWADAVATYFAQYFRSAFVMNFAFAALAVVAASASVMMGHVDERWKHIPVAIEILLIVCVVLNTVFGLMKHWHLRWVEAREVAERLRGALPLWMLGLRPAFFPGEEPTWTGWYARAILRGQRLRPGKLDAQGLDVSRAALLKLLIGQCDYNHANAKCVRWLGRALEAIGLIALAATLAVAIDHLFDNPIMHCIAGHSAHELTIWLSAALPALATASYGIRIIGNFEEVAHRGERTRHNLGQLIAAIKQDPPILALLRARARSAADVMLGDVASWRLAAESRGLAIPG